MGIRWGILGQCRVVQKNRGFARGFSANYQFWSLCLGPFRKRKMHHELFFCTNFLNTARSRDIPAKIPGLSGLPNANTKRSKKRKTKSSYGKKNKEFKKKTRKGRIGFFQGERLHGGPRGSGLPHANAKSQRFSYAIAQITPLPPVAALNRNSNSQIAARTAFWHAISQIALASFLECPYIAAF